MTFATRASQSEPFHSIHIPRNQILQNFKKEKIIGLHCTKIGTAKKIFRKKAFDYFVVCKGNNTCEPEMIIMVMIIIFFLQSNFRHCHVACENVVSCLKKE
jgi:ssDNA-binding Zn-finger/Zn-ribbon topoisomerase 1